MNNHSKNNVFARCLWFTNDAFVTFKLRKLFVHLRKTPNILTQHGSNHDAQGICDVLGVKKDLTRFNPFIQGRLRYVGLGC